MREADVRIMFKCCCGAAKSSFSELVRHASDECARRTDEIQFDVMAENDLGAQQPACDEVAPRPRRTRKGPTEVRQEVGWLASTLRWAAQELPAGANPDSVFCNDIA